MYCLQQVADGKIKRLMGLMPPGSGKSIFTSVVFPTYFLGRFPRTTVILTSYGSDLPRKFGRRARTIVKSKQYQRIFDTTLSDESSAVDEWALTNGSDWMAAGILTGITGNRADGIVWDDLIKGREQADSDVTRAKTWEAYVDDLLTRKKPHAWEVGINTRWHEDDPAGRILPADYNGESGWIKCQDGNDWYVVCLQAECERADDPLGRKIGEMLWPEWFTQEHFNTFRRNPRTWSALFQQRPAPDSGDFFKAEWLIPYSRPGEASAKTVLPPIKELTIYGASDCAVTAQGGDYTVHVIVGMDQYNRLFLLDVWRQQTSPDIWVEALLDLVVKWKPAGWAMEKGQIDLSVGPFLNKRMMERRDFIYIAKFPSVTKKEMRAQPIRGLMGVSGLYVPINAPWYPNFRSELMSFPAGRTNDQVDALGLIGQILDRMVPGKKAEASRDKPKVLSVDPTQCTVTLDDLFEDNERYSRQGSRILRIH